MITLQVGVKVLLKNEYGKFLLLKRNSNKYPKVRGHWDIVGGRINPGIPLIENLKREIYEETNLTLIETPMLIAAQDILNDPQKHVVRLTYVANLSGDPKLDFEENEEFKWLTFEEIQKLDDLDFYFRKLIMEVNFERLMK